MALYPRECTIIHIQRRQPGCASMQSRYTTAGMHEHATTLHEHRAGGDSAATASIMIHLQHPSPASIYSLHDFAGQTSLLVKHLCWAMTLLTQCRVCSEGVSDDSAEADLAPLLAFTTVLAFTTLLKSKHLRWAFLPVWKRR
jgi:hypothetical protein